MGRRKVRWPIVVSSVLALACGAVSTRLCSDTALAQSQPPAKKALPPKSAAVDSDAQPEAADKKVAGRPFPTRFPAPALDGGTEWLNTSGPLSLKDLRGKVVLLDFWTYCCINCMHVLPDLKYLERKYGRQLVVIGVHSAKFENERDSDNIRGALMRYEIEHPVINDSRMILWQKFGVSSWPTFVLIDPEGYYCRQFAGEGNREQLDMSVGNLVKWYRAKKSLDETPVAFNLERDKAVPTPLRFPGKVVADAAGDRLFIADSGHNRIVITSLEGKLLEVIGKGTIGKAGGSYDKAEFDHPQGLAVGGQTLHVADTENHLIREVDLQRKIVKAFAGTGEQSRHGARGGAPQATALNSPWDLVRANGKLYVAMAGPHQIWQVELPPRQIRAYAGSGKEDIANGPLMEAALAQPSGITTDGKFLYVVDSEGSAVRRVPLAPRGIVETLAGTSDLAQGRCLFEFGDRDGTGSEARLQHPLGIVHHGGHLYIADSYNHKIKRLDPQTRTIETYLGDGRPGDSDEPPRFSEPGGLSVAGETLYVADTNNHRIRTVDLRTGKVSTLTINGLTPPSPSPPSGDVVVTGTPIKLALQKVAPAAALTFEIALALPPDYKLNKLAPLTYRLGAAGDQKLVDAKLLGRRQKVEPPEGNLLTVQVPLTGQSGKGDLQLTLSYAYCRDGEGGLCKLNTITWSVPIELAANATKRLIELKAE